MPRIGNGPDGIARLAQQGDSRGGVIRSGWIAVQQAIGFGAVSSKDDALPALSRMK
jgi:hypothetical protein